MTKRQHFTLEEVLDNVLSDEELDYIDDPDEPMMEGSNDEFSDLEIDGEIFSDDSEMDTAPSGSDSHTPHSHSTSYDMHSTQGLSAYIHNSISQIHQPQNNFVKNIRTHSSPDPHTRSFFLCLCSIDLPGSLSTFGHSQNFPPSMSPHSQATPTTSPHSQTTPTISPHSSTTPTSLTGSDPHSTAPHTPGT